MIEEPNYIQVISSKLNLNESNVKAVLDLLGEDATIPFIARYRKEVTGNLDENKIREILDLKNYEEKLFKLKKSVLENIDSQGKLSDDLKNNISLSKTLQEVEDFYAPYKQRKKTKADIARENGFDVVAEQIRKQQKIEVTQYLLDSFSYDEIIDGACSIISQDIADDVDNKKAIRYFYFKYGEISSNYRLEKKLADLGEKAAAQIHKFEIYDGFESDVVKLKSYQILALNRGESLGILDVKLIDDVLALEALEEKLILFDGENDSTQLLKKSLKQGYKKIFSSIENELRGELTKKAHETAIISFQDNLEKLLMTKPQYGKRVLAIDPGFRTGCKIVVLDEFSNPQEFSKIYIHDGRKEDAVVLVKNLVVKFNVDVVVIGNGTASNEVYDILSSKIDIPFVIVNESGASVYSASKIAQEEFENLDLTDRGTISIGRRFIDPLSELVKIPVASIGVGMYQHDINEKQLEEKLGFVVEDVVNLVGINVNTASIYVLQYVSGLNKKSAQKILDNRPYRKREELKKILSKKAYEQSVGFLRVNDSVEEFDKTSIHPEQYDVARYIIENNLNEYESNSFKLKQIYSLINKQVFDDIVLAYKNKGQDLRKYEAVLKIKKTITIDDVKEDDIVDGVVRNIMQFGVFVDIGLKNDGLIHISELADRFVKDPSDVVQIGEQLKVKILSIDKEKGKIQLSLKQV